MINKIIESVLPAIITAISGYLIAKYQYSKNVPLDNFRIVYDGVYFPIYQLLRENRNVKVVDNEKIFLEIKKLCKEYIHKYIKYVDRSTIKAFENLDKSSNKKELKRAYDTFENNIYNFNGFLRRRLGYLEPNLFSIYSYASENDKRLMRIIFEWMFFYCAFIIYQFMPKDNIKILEKVAMTAVILLVFLIAEVLVAFVNMYKNKVFLFIKKTCSKLKAICVCVGNKFKVSKNTYEMKSIQSVLDFMAQFNDINVKKVSNKENYEIVKMLVGNQCFLCLWKDEEFVYICIKQYNLLSELTRKRTTNDKKYIEVWKKIVLDAKISDEKLKKMLVKSYKLS